MNIVWNLSTPFQLDGRNPATVLKPLTWLWEDYLLSGIWREVEGEDGEEWDAHARDDEVHRVEERLASHRYVKRYVQIRLHAARVEFLTPSVVLVTNHSTFINEVIRSFVERFFSKCQPNQSQLLVATA